MKEKIIILLLLIFCFKSINAQLVSLFSIKHTIATNTMIFEKFSIKLVKENDFYCLKALKTDSMIFKPKMKCFYEVYNGKYIIATYIDTSIYKPTTSISPEFFPRKEAVIIKMDGDNMPNKIYTVNFQSKIIHDPIELNFNDLKKNISESDYDSQDVEQNIQSIKSQYEKMYAIVNIEENKNKITLRNKKQKLKLKMFLLR